MESTQAMADLERKHDFSGLGITKQEEPIGLLKHLPAPTMLYNSHEGEVLSVEFSPDGSNLASGSFDKSIMVSHVYGECDNWCVLKGHTNAVTEIHWSPDGKHIHSCSADNTLALWDVELGVRLKKFNGHTAIVNSCHVTRRGAWLVVSGADDGTTKIWDNRIKRCVKSFDHQYQILSVTFDDMTERVFAGSLDNTIRVFDLTAGKEDACMTGHVDSITGVDVSTDGCHLITNSMDQSVRIWDIRPYFVGETRCVTTLTGACHNFEKNLLRVRWSKDEKYCAVGSADKTVYIWDTNTKELAYKLPGHNGSVNEVCFHPSKPIVASCSSDKTVFVGELL